jgi:hypothetical protein
MKKGLLFLSIVLLINFSSAPENSKAQIATRNPQLVKLLLASINPASLFLPGKITNKRSPFTYDRENDIWYFEFAKQHGDHNAYLAAFRPGKNSVQIRIFPPTTFCQPFFIGQIRNLADCIIIRGVYSDFSKHEIKKIPQNFADLKEKIYSQKMEK